MDFNNSSNCNRLKETAIAAGKPAYLISSPEEIKSEWLDGIKKIGIKIEKELLFGSSDTAKADDDSNGADENGDADETEDDAEDADADADEDNNADADDDAEDSD